VDHVNIEIRRGEMYGFLGPNGAGKTTMMMMILGVLRPTSGEVRLFGKQMSEDPFEIKRRIGVVVEAQSYYDEMTAWEYLLFFGKLYAAKDATTRGQLLLERLGLWQWRDALIGEYSTGMQRKLAIARALLHSPELLILDEPVASLDPFGVKQVRELLLDERAAGRTLLISSHILSEIERTADRVGIISHGKLLFEDTVANLRLRSDEGCIEIELIESADGLDRALLALPFVLKVEAKERRLTVVTQAGHDHRADVARAIAAHGALVTDMRAVHPSLEDVFVTITEAEVKDWSGSRSD